MRNWIRAGIIGAIVASSVGENAFAGVAPTITVGCSTYIIGSISTSYSASVAEITSQPWWGDSTLAREFADAYNAAVTTSLDGATYNLFSHTYRSDNNNVYSVIYTPDRIINSNQNAGYSSPNNSFMTATQLTTPNNPPVASAGPDQLSVTSASTVNLDGSSSNDLDSCDTLTYAWTKTSGPDMDLTGATTAQPTFTTPTLGANDSAVTFVFSLVVTDDKSNASAADTVTITVNPPANSAPTANAGPDQTSRGIVTLDGTGSTDPDTGDTLSYAWTKTSGPDMDLTGATTAQPTFTTPTLGANDSAVTFVFSLVVTDDKSNASAADTVTITVNPPQNPAAEFEAAKEEITQVLTADAQRSLNSAITSNTRLTRAARGRFLTSRQQMQGDDSGFASRNNAEFDVDGTAEATGLTLSTKGTFFAQNGNFEGTKRSLVFGDFDIQHDGDTGSTTATLNGKIAWEQMLSEQTMLGYYLGGEVARSNIRGSFTGTQDKYGVSVGGYFVHALQENLFLDGFASLGAGRNNLEMADDTLGLTSDYTTKTATLGAALSGVIEQEGYDILPEMSFAYGKTFIGDVGFTGTAYGLVDNTLSLDAGDVSTATLMFRPEFRFALDGQKSSESLSTLSFAPRVMCEQQKVGGVTSDNCGGGAELGVTSSTSDGLSSATTKLVVDRVGNSTRSSLQFQLEHKF